MAHGVNTLWIFQEERERILYKNFVQVGQDVKEMIKDVLNKRGAK